MSWTGIITALVTPFARDGGSVDIGRFRQLVTRQAAAGVSGIVIGGTTGEGPTLSQAEKRALVSAAAAEAGDHMHIIAGISGNDTQAVQDMVRDFAATGAIDGIMATCPYYNKPSQAGLKAHMQAVTAAAGDMPVLIYNVPGRVGVNMTPDTVAALAGADAGIAGIKEASGDYNQIAELARRFEGTDFRVLAGDDSMAFPVMTLGGAGVVSVLANALPHRMQDMSLSLQRGDMATARRHYLQLLPLMRASFLGGNPAGIKGLMAHMGLLENNLRLPLVPQTQAEHDELIRTYTHMPQMDAKEAC